MRRLSVPILLAIAFASLPSGGVARAASAQFTEVSASAGVDVSYDVFTLFDLWDYTGGGAVGDFNGDGWQDLFVFSGATGGKPDYLFINNRDGTFTDRAVQWGLKRYQFGKGAAVADYDGDGDLDLFVTSAGDFQRITPGHHKLYRNNGDETFTNVAWDAGVAFSAPPDSEENGWGSTFGDYDLDGDLDLFVAGFGDQNRASRLFRNEGDGTFTDVTDTIGLFAQTPLQLYAFAPRFADMDGDRYPELLLVADFGTSRYLRNDGDGTFSDITIPSATSKEENGMGQTVGDFDNDGRPDWYVTSIFYTPNSWTGNKLYLNQGNHVYTESAAALGVDDGGYGWGTVAVDFNHDGLLDIAETNGDGGGTFGGAFDGEPSYLWIQQPGGTFSEQAATAGLNHTDRGRGMLNFDYDNDGDQDVVIFTLAGQLRLFRNDVGGNDAHWLRVFLDTSGQPGLAPNGVGAEVTVTAAGQTQHRWIDAGDNFLSHGELSAHFGLATATTVDTLRVDWPDGTSTVLADVTADRTITIAAGPREQSCMNGTDDDNDGDTDCDDTDCCGRPGCQNGEGVCCTTAGECADGSFCNGVEQCVDDVCVAGADPCPGDRCDEGGNVCVECTSDAICDDGVVCNGVEVCSAGLCSPGADPCPGQLCEELRGICVDCLSDNDCPDDGLFCNGAEVCNHLGRCDSDNQPCAGRWCDDGANQCVGVVSLQPKLGEPDNLATIGDLARFEAGRALFERSLTLADGLGPIHGAHACASCHDTGGGAANAVTSTYFGQDDLAGGITPQPGGPLFQPLATAPTCQETIPAAADVLTSRTAGELAGLGLLQMVPDANLHARAYDPPAGISGRAQFAPIPEDPGETGMTRFGWKATGVTVLDHVARQARDQLGLTNRLYPEEQAPNDDQLLLAQCDTVADPEDSPGATGLEAIDLLASYVRLLTAPPRTPKSGMSGASVFSTIRCDACHAPFAFTSGDPRVERALAGRFFFPYTDALTHDMGANGEAMAEGDAGPREVLTPPLWGLLHRDPMWHDGRFAGGTFASRVEAAIAAHDTPGSEGILAAQAYAALPQADKDALLAFLGSLGRAEFDHDGDNDVDADDFAQLTSCFTGPGASYTADDPCSISDVDQDGDVDLDDQQMFEIAADGAAGAVPDGGANPGVPLTLDKPGGGQVRLGWGASCSGADTDYAVYEGPIGSFAAHTPRECSTGGATTRDYTPDVASVYYLVVPTTGFREGSYGLDGDGSERPVSTAACEVQVLGACGP